MNQEHQAAAAQTPGRHGGENPVTSPLHVQVLRSIIPLKSGLSFMIVNAWQVGKAQFRILEVPEILYLAGHSHPKYGMKLSDDTHVDQGLMRAYLDGRNPRFLFLNTCYGMETGLATAAINAGVETVIAAFGPIPIVHMAGYAEEFFSKWAEGNLTARNALDEVNKGFAGKEIQFTCLGDQGMTLKGLGRFGLC